MIVSHRLLRYVDRRSCTWSRSAPTSLLLGDGLAVYVVTLALQLALLLAALARARVRARAACWSPATTC